MREIYQALQGMAERRERGALVTVVGTRGSTPRKAGAKMLILSGGGIVGTIGGGCVEAEVWQESREVMTAGEPKLLTYSLTADLAADTGMICGGVMDMFLEPVTGSEDPWDASHLARQLLEALGRNETVALATVIQSSLPEVKPGMKLLVKEDGPSPGPLAGSPLEEILVEDCRTMIRQGPAVRLAPYSFDAGARSEAAVEVFLEVLRNPPTAVVVGAGHIGLHVARIAKAVGFDVIVIDDRADFASPERFPEADRVISGDMAEALANLRLARNSYVVLVTRGHQQDEVTLRQVVNTPAAYVGMIGSRQRVRTVKDRLIRDGFPRDRVEAVYAPIGLNLGAETPEEIALSIVAELVKVHRGGDAESLKDRSNHRNPSGRRGARWKT